MGSLRAFDVAKFAHDFGLRRFVETGTGRGDSRSVRRRHAAVLDSGFMRVGATSRDRRDRALCERHANSYLPNGERAVH